jgi:hypothetical protein
MRLLQVILFFIAILAFIISLFYIGALMGDVLWRAGMAILLLDVAFMMLWPQKAKE